MSTAGSSAILALLLLTSIATSAGAQDTVTATAPHRLAFDAARVRPFHRVYEMLVHRADSTDSIGTRDIEVQQSLYANAPAWLVTEMRTGTVPSVDSLFVGLDLRPLHWSSALGLARLALEFVGDSIYGAVTTPASKQNVVVSAAPDLLAASAFLDVAMSALPLAPGWSDSAAVLALDAASHTLHPTTIAVVGEEELAVDSTLTRVLVVALRSDSANSLYWVDRTDGSVLRVVRSLPSHVGTTLEYRLRVATVTPSSPP